MVFSNLAIETKRKAPNAHSEWIICPSHPYILRRHSAFLEILRVRYGTFVHISFMVSARVIYFIFAGLITFTVLLSCSKHSESPLQAQLKFWHFSIQLVVSSVLLGGSAAISALTGINGNSPWLRAIFYHDSLCLLRSVRGAVCMFYMTRTA